MPRKTTKGESTWITAYVDEATKRQFRVAAAEEGKSMAALLGELVESYVRKRKKETHA